MSGKSTYIIYVYIYSIYSCKLLVYLIFLQRSLQQRYQGCSDSDSVESEDPLGPGGLCCQD